MHAAHRNAIQSKLDAAMIFARPNCCGRWTSAIDEFAGIIRICFDPLRCGQTSDIFFSTFRPTQSDTVPAAEQFPSGIMAI